MYLNKKKKLILAWTIPTAAIVATAAIVPPILITSENSKYQKLIDAQNITPKSFNEMTNEQLNSLFYNPKDFDVNFFSYQLVDSVLKNDVFAFDGNFEKVVERTSDDKISNIYWLDKNSNVKYEIEKVVKSANQSSKENMYSFNLTIKKSFEGASQEYQSTIEIPTSSFADETISSKNFIAKKAKEINSLFSGQIIRTILNPENNNDNIIDISGITSANNLSLTSSSSNYPITMKKIGSSTSYLIDGQNLKYLNKNIALSFPFVDGSTKLIADAQNAYKFTAKDQFDTNLEIFKFLKKEHTAGNLPYLPELSTAESTGLTEEEKLNKQIQKLIFDPETNPIYQVDEFGNKVPLSSYQAYVVKVSLNGASTYLVSWSNVFSLSNTIVDNAPEMALTVNKKNGGQSLTYETIVQQENYGLIVTTTKPSNGLIYKVVNVEFDPSDIYKTSAIATVEVSHPSVTSKKTYKTTITSGFLSKAYVDLEKEINNLIGADYSQVNKLIPTVALKEGVIYEDFVNSDLNNLTNVLNSIDITPPQGLSNVKYTPTLAKISGNQLLVTFQISSVNDPEKYWEFNNAIQTVTSTTTLNINKPVSLDS